MVFAILVVVYFVALYYFQISGRAREIDFSQYYVWAYAARHGINPYVWANLLPLARRFGLDAMTANYPPFFILLFEPLSLLTPQRAFWLWSGINLVLMLIAVQMLVWDLGDFQKRLLFGAAALLYGPVTDALYWSQAETAVFFLLVIALHGLQTRKDYLCGIALGVAALCKVYPILLLGCFLLCRRKAVVVSAGLTVLAGIAVSAVVFSAQVNVAFLNQLLNTGGDEFWPYTMNVSIGAVISRFCGLISGKPGFAVKIFRTLAIVLSEALAAAMTIYATLIAKRRGDDNQAFGLWVAAAVLLTPIIWLHHLINLLIPFAQLTYATTPKRVALKLRAFSYGFAELALAMYWVRWRIWPAYDLATQFVIGCATFGALLLAFGATFRLCTGNPKTGDESPMDMSKLRLELPRFGGRRRACG